MNLKTEYFNLPLVTQHLKSMLFILLGAITFNISQVAAIDAAELEQALQLMEQQGMPAEQIEQIKKQLEAVQKLETVQQNNSKESAKQQTPTAETDEAQNIMADEDLDTEPGSLTILANDLLYNFDIKQCIAGTIKQGQLTVHADVYAVGTIGDQPTVMQLNKSDSPSGQFQTLKINLLELKDDEQNLSYDELLNKRGKEFNDWHTPRQAAIQAKYQITNDMSVEQLNEQMNKQSEAYDALKKEADARRIPNLLEHGSIEVEDDVIRYHGKMNRSQQGLPATFSSLIGHPIQVVARCIQ